MTEAPASLLVPALIRQVFADGGAATVLHKGHSSGHALILVHQPASGEARAFERVPGLGDAPQWRLAASGDEAVARFCARQQEFDPDIWILELSVAAPERFVAGLPPSD